MTLLKAYSLGGPGGSNDVKLVSSKKASAAFYAYVKSFNLPTFGDMGMSTPKCGKSAELKEITVAAGTFQCETVEPQFDADQKEGMLPEQIEMWSQGMSTYFSKDVPRLIPMELIVNIIVGSNLGFLKECEGGLVKNIQYQLTEYKKGSAAK